MDASNRVYEEFDPHFEWLQEEECDTLILVLTGFRKEQLRAQIIRRGILKINGEQQITGNLNRRFHKEFQIPSNYNTKEIQAKFEGGLLFIKLPKLLKLATKPPEEVPRPQQPPATTAPPPPKPREEKVEEKNIADSPKKEESDNAKGKLETEAFVADEVSHLKEKSTDGMDGNDKTTNSTTMKENEAFGGRLGEHEEKIDKTREEKEENVGLEVGFEKSLVNVIMAIVLFLLLGMFVISSIVSSLGGSKSQEL